MRANRICVLLLAASTFGARADAPLLRDANGTIVGTYTGILENGGLVAISSTGYRFVVWRENGWLRGTNDESNEVLYFENFNCTGQAYLDRGPQYRGTLVPIRAVFFELAALYYVPQTAVPANVTYNGRLQGGANGGLSCVQIAPRSSTGVPALLNDPNVTGVPTSDLASPLSVTRNELFRNGFESTALTAAAISAGVA